MQPLRYQVVAAAQDIPIKLLPRFPWVGRQGGSSFAWAPAVGAPVLGRRDSLRGSAPSGTAWPVLPSTTHLSVRWPWGAGDRGGVEHPLHSLWAAFQVQPCCASAAWGEPRALGQESSLVWQLISLAS